jgi:elongation factor Ts
MRLNQPMVVLLGRETSLSSSHRWLSSTSSEPDLFVQNKEQKPKMLELVRRLRDKTGAPIKDVKQALDETGGDFDKACDWLRETGAAKASQKVAGRVTAEGLIAINISDDGTSASLVKVSSETDFAGRSKPFVELTHSIAESIVAKSDLIGDIKPEQILVLKAKNGDKSVKALLDEAIVAIRENINVSEAVAMKSENGLLVGYVHNRVALDVPAGTSAAIVEILPLEEEVSDDMIRDVGKKLAMHIVACRPKYMTRDDVPADIVERERKFLYTEAAYSGKQSNLLEKIAQGRLPEDYIDKIVAGKLRKWYEKIALVEQNHMIEYGFPKIGDFLARNGMALKGFRWMSIIDDPTKVTYHSQPVTFDQLAPGAPGAAENDGDATASHNTADESGVTFSEDADTPSSAEESASAFASMTSSDDAESKLSSAEESAAAFESLASSAEESASVFESMPTNKEEEDRKSS